ncbi:MAG TPA: BBE domain-containing protein, partial [Solirubrobacteraceae bacterium]
DPAPHIAWARDTFAALEPFGTGRAYVNFLADEGQDRVRAAYGEEKYRRLVGLKRAYDPDNVFHLNQNVDPRGSHSTCGERAR